MRSTALWQQNNVKAYVYPTGYLRCPFRYSTGSCGCRTGLGSSYDQSCRIVRSLCCAPTGPIGTIRPSSLYMKLPASLQAPCGRNPNRTVCRAGPYNILCSIHNSRHGTFLRVNARRRPGTVVWACTDARTDRLVYVPRTRTARTTDHTDIPKSVRHPHMNLTEPFRVRIWTLANMQRTHRAPVCM